MSIKDEVKKRGLALLGDPRMAKLMQNEQFMRAMMTVIQVPGKVEHFTSEQTERFAKMLSSQPQALPAAARPSPRNRFLHGA